MTTNFDIAQFVSDCVRTESWPDGEMRQRLGHVDAIRLLHAGMGMATEAGEFLDGLKKHIFYGKPLDRVNLVEELGDLLWYIAVACDDLEISMAGVMDKVIAKLKARYPEKYSHDAAVNRNLSAEREVLEQ